MAAVSAIRMPRLSSADLWVVALGSAYVLAVLPICPELASPDQALAVLVNASPLVVLALGQMFVLLIGAIDLSVSGVISLAGVVAALVMVSDDGLAEAPALAIPLALVALLLVGLVIGVLHGAAVAWLAMPAFLVTMANMMALGGAAVWITGGERIGGLPVALLDAVQESWFGVPAMIWIAAALAIATHLVLQHTVIGKHLYAVGHNPRAARVSGIPVGRVTCFAFVMSALFSAVAALLYTCRAESATPVFAREILLDAIGAAVIGGTSLSGGRASTFGVVCGALFITLIANSLTLMNLAYWHVLMAKGGIILLAALADSARRRWLSREVSS
jgi:ribose/xylose/arabinose/galactoside ABC-type transport system permease subunit